MSPAKKKARSEMLFQVRRHMNILSRHTRRELAEKALAVYGSRVRIDGVRLTRTIFFIEYEEGGKQVGLVDTADSKGLAISMAKNCCEGTDWSWRICEAVVDLSAVVASGDGK